MNAPPSWAISMPMQVRWSNTDGIHQCSMSRANPKPLDASIRRLLSLCIALAAARATANKTMMKKGTNFAGHLDGRGGALVQYHAHCPMKEVQGFGRSHWMPPLGKYCCNWSSICWFCLSFFIINL